MFEKIEKALTGVEQGIMAGGLVIASAILFINIVLRYVFNSGIHWAEEFVRFAIMWIVFIGASTAAKRGAHLSVSAVVDNVNPKAARVIEIISLSLTIGFTLFMAVFGWKLTMATKASNQLTPSMMIPTYLIYLSIPLGGALMSFRYVQLLWNFIYRKELSQISEETK